MLFDLSDQAKLGTPKFVSARYMNNAADYPSASRRIAV